MRLTLLVRIAAPAVLLATAGHARAQFITSITRPVFSEGPTQVYNVNVQTGTSTEIFDPRFSTPAIPASAPGFTGLAADEANRRLFAITTNGTRSDLYSLDYATRTPTLLASISRPGSSSGLVLDGLGYDSRRGVLYGTRTISNGADQLEGLYTINIATGATTLAIAYEPTSASNFQIGGLDYDPTTDRLYLADDDVDGGRNLYSVDPANIGAGLSLLTAYPSGVTDIDGIGAGGGRLYLLSDSQDTPSTSAVEGNGGLHRVFNVLTAQFEDSIASPYPQRTTTNAALGLIDPTGGGAYAPGIPAPGAAVLLAGVLAATRRRR